MVGSQDAPPQYSYVTAKRHLDKKHKLNSPFAPSWKRVSKLVPSITVLKLDLVVFDNSVRLLLIHLFALTIVGVTLCVRHGSRLACFYSSHFEA